MITLPPPKIITVDGYTVIDDHEVGTKYRMALELASQSLKRDFYYATTESGDSPAALARACQQMGKRLTLFVTKLSSDRYTPTLELAKAFGANIIPHEKSEYDYAYDHASKAARHDGAELIDFDNRAAIEVLARIARSLGLDPRGVWSASAKGAMSRAYQLAWPNAEHHSVAVMDYAAADFGTSIVHRTDSLYEEPFRGKTAFPCNRNYEAKAWNVMKTIAKPSKDIIFWNPAGPN